MMNRKSTLIVAALLAVTASSFAIEGEQIPVPGYTSLSRDEVTAELRDLRASGALVQRGELSTTPLEALDRDRAIAQMQPAAPVGVASARTDGDAVLERYLERTSADDTQPNTVTVWVPAHASGEIEAIPMDGQAAPDIGTIFQHPAVAPADAAPADE